MAYLNFQQHTHSDRLERWLGADQVQRVTDSMREWYGPPIALAGVPGNVRAAKGGDFIGHVDAGQFGSATDRLEDALRRAWRNGRERYARWAVQQLSTVNAFPASLDNLVAASGAGKTRQIAFQKVGPTGVIGVTSSLWRVGNQPAAGGAGSAAPGGRAPTGAILAYLARHGVSAKAIGVDPVHFGVILILNAGIGLNTPPVGSVIGIPAPMAAAMGSVISPARLAPADSTD